jgi:hypothetical protein
MKLVQATQDAFEGACVAGFRTYTPAAKHFSFKLDIEEIGRLGAGGVLVMRVPAEGGLPELSVQDEPREHRVIRK